MLKDCDHGVRTRHFIMEILKQVCAAFNLGSAIKHYIKHFGTYGCPKIREFSGKCILFEAWERHW